MRYPNPHNQEPPLEQLLADGPTQLVMQRDGVNPRWLQEMLDQTAREMRIRPASGRAL